MKLGVSQPKGCLRKTLFASVAAVALLALPAAVQQVTGIDVDSVTAAQAAQGEGKQYKGGRAGDAGGGGEQGVGGTRGKVLEDILRGSKRDMTSEDEDEDSERPDWAGGGGKPGTGKPPGAGTMKGDLFGDMYVLLRDENGLPITTTVGGEEYVQPVAFDAEGNPVYYIDADGDGVHDATETVVLIGPGGDYVDEDGNPVTVDENQLARLTLELDEEGSVAEDNSYFPSEVELGRLNVGRSPESVTLHSLDEALYAIYQADTILLDPSGRFTLVTDGEEKTIDSPLENLALYISLINNGAIQVPEYDENGNPVVDDDGNPVYVTKEVVDEDGNVIYTMATDPTGDLSQADMDVAASLLAAASDKTGTITVDEVAYYNLILGVNGEFTGIDGEYVDFSAFTYDRASAYDGVTAEVLVQQADGSYTVEVVDVLDVVFGGEDGVFDPATENMVADNIDGFSAAADDAVQVLEFVHEYTAPETL